MRVEYFEQVIQYDIRVLDFPIYLQTPNELDTQ